MNDLRLAMLGMLKVNQCIRILYSLQVTLYVYNYKRDVAYKHSWSARGVVKLGSTNIWRWRGGGNRDGQRRSVDGFKYRADLTMFVLYIGSFFEPVIFLNEILRWGPLQDRHTYTSLDGGGLALEAQGPSPPPSEHSLKLPTIHKCSHDTIIQLHKRVASMLIAFTTRVNCCHNYRRFFIQAARFLFYFFVSR